VSKSFVLNVSHHGIFLFVSGTELDDDRRGNAQDRSDPRSRPNENRIAYTSDSN
jgi:hypothetical protein